MYENKHDEINYRNKLAKMNIEKAETFLAKKNKTSLDESFSAHVSFSSYRYFCF